MKKNKRKKEEVGDEGRWKTKKERKGERKKELSFNLGHREKLTSTIVSSVLEVSSHRRRYQR
jgi:hypothetical protein